MSAPIDSELAADPSDRPYAPIAAAVVVVAALLVGAGALAVSSVLGSDIVRLLVALVLLGGGLWIALPAGDRRHPATLALGAHVLRGIGTSYAVLGAYLGGLALLTASIPDAPIISGENAGPSTTAVILMVYGIPALALLAVATTGMRAWTAGAGAILPMITVLLMVDGGAGPAVVSVTMLVVALVLAVLVVRTRAGSTWAGVASAAAAMATSFAFGAGSSPFGTLGATQLAGGAGTTPAGRLGAGALIAVLTGSLLLAAILLLLAVARRDLASGVLVGSIFAMPPVLLSTWLPPEARWPAEAMAALAAAPVLVALTAALAIRVPRVRDALVAVLYPKSPTRPDEPPAPPPTDDPWNKRPTGMAPADGRSEDEGPAGGGSAGGGSADEGPAGERPAAAVPARAAPSGAALSGERRANVRLANGAPVGDGPTDVAPTDGAPTGEAPTGEAPTGEGPPDEAPTDEPPMGEGPTGKSPTDVPSTGEPSDPAEAPDSNPPQTTKQRESRPSGAIATAACAVVVTAAAVVFVVLAVPVFGWDPRAQGAVALLVLVAAGALGYWLPATRGVPGVPGVPGATGAVGAVGVPGAAGAIVALLGLSLGSPWARLLTGAWASTSQTERIITGVLDLASAAALAWVLTRRHPRPAVYAAAAYTLAWAMAAFIGVLLFDPGYLTTGGQPFAGDLAPVTILTLPLLLLGLAALVGLLRGHVAIGQAVGAVVLAAGGFVPLKILVGQYAGGGIDDYALQFALNPLTPTDWLQTSAALREVTGPALVAVLVMVLLALALATSLVTRPSAPLAGAVALLLLAAVQSSLLTVLSTGSTDDVEVLGQVLGGLALVTAAIAVATAVTAARRG